MNHIKTYNDYNEGLKSAVAGVGLAGALLSGSPDVQAREREPITMGTEMPSQDGVLVYENTLDYTSKKVLLSIDSKSLGDNIAWMPYLEEFRKTNK